MRRWQASAESRMEQATLHSYQRVRHHTACMQAFASDESARQVAPMPPDPLLRQFHLYVAHLGRNPNVLPARDLPNPETDCKPPRVGTKTGPFGPPPKRKQQT